MKNISNNGGANLRPAIGIDNANAAHLASADDAYRTNTQMLCCNAGNTPIAGKISGSVEFAYRRRYHYDQHGKLLEHHGG